MPKAKGHHVGKKLTAVTVSAAKKPGLYSDGLGLYLQVSSFDTKAWVFRYILDGRARKMGLGPLHTVSLAEARKRAAEARLKVLDDIDPVTEKHAQRASKRLEAAKAVTFKQCAEAYIDAHRNGWRNARHAYQWPSTLATYAYPMFGNLPVQSIDVALVMKVLEPIWRDKTETASRLRGRIEAVLDWAKVRGYRDGENPARWRGHLDHLLPARSDVAPRKHLHAVPFRDLPAFMARLRKHDGVEATALEFCILTAARTGDVLSARWSEIDLAQKLWTIPGERMKSGKEHRVALSERAINILTALPRDGELVFNRENGAPLADNALLVVAKDCGATTVHGTRSSFRDWVAEATSYPSELAEIALAHTVGSAVERAYRRGDMMEKRRRLMADWASFLKRPPSTEGKVVPIRSAQ
jgi:integrase